MSVEVCATVVCTISCSQIRSDFATTDKDGNIICVEHEEE